MRQSGKAMERLRMAVLLLLLAAVLFFVGRRLYDCRITASVVGNKLYYKEAMYVECLDSSLPLDTGRCLGSVRYELGETCRFYELKGLPEYLYVSLGWEYRLYRLCEAE